MGDQGEGGRAWYRRTGGVVTLAVVGALVLGGVGLALVGGDDSSGPEVVADGSGTTEPRSSEPVLECEEILPEPVQPVQPAPIDDRSQSRVRPPESNTPDTRARPEGESTDDPAAESGGAVPASGPPVRVGEAVCLDGYVAAVTEAEESDGRVTVSVVVENQTDEPQTYTPLDWRFRSEGGDDVTPTSNRSDDRLGTGDLAPGEHVEGTVVFSIGAGNHVVVWQPDSTDEAARGAWAVEV